MFHKILIANRGEIACRVIKTARRMGIQTVAVFSDVDRESLHVSMADEAVHIGAAPSHDSYLQMERIIAAAQQTGAEAIHPGYGFLSENAAFCQRCKDHNIVFIGPPISAIETMGSKSAAKTLMEKAGIPVIPGYHGDVQRPSALKKSADAMGYPVLIKAAAGGGGKGLRKVQSETEFYEALAAAKREALSAFNDDIMLVEKYLTQPRHVEIQVFFDQHNNAVYLAERDCSVQRRHQKVIEEAPAPGLTDALRQTMGETAINAARAVHYVGAGTVEFLLDQSNSFYFMEMNTRLQVEHPVTEMITGQDLVEWQLRVAANEKLPLQQAEIVINGHAFEARIYAEDPANNFLPVSGTLSYLEPPVENTHTRIDTGVRQGDEVSVYYDPMIAKLIVWDEDRNKALRRLAKALSEYHINGLTTNIDFLYKLSTCQPFAQANLNTSFIEKHYAALLYNKELDDKELDDKEFYDKRPHDNSNDSANPIPLAALYLVLQQQQVAQQQASQSTDPHSPWHHSNSWRLNETHRHHFNLLYQQQAVAVQVEQINHSRTIYYRIYYRISSHINSATVAVEANGHIDGNLLTSEINGYRSQVTVSEHDGIYSLYSQRSVFQVSLLEPDLGEQETGAADNSLCAPMNGIIIELLVTPGSNVKKSDALLVMEAMKMEHTIRAPADGRVQAFYFQPGESVDGGSTLLAFAQD
ncbi:MAG: acetyl/propionyl/methylcrotonyl-CoA carboxylase subunit alpha [Pseudomonadales bacterium]